MRLTWDPVKSATNLQLRGFDVAMAKLIFAGRTLERVDSRQDYFERRVIAIGVAEGIVITVCYTDRIGSGGELERRIISAHRSSRRERKEYAEAGEVG